MKKIILSLVAVTLVACSTVKRASSSPSDYIFTGDKVLSLDSTILATLSSFEYEYYKGELVREVSLTATQQLRRSEIEDLLIAIDKHFKGRNKIEVNFDND
jgi:hypothetical protein